MSTGSVPVDPTAVAAAPDQTAYGFAQALLGGDAAAAAACFAGEARLMTADGTEISGADAIGEVLGQIVDSEMQLEIRLGRTLRAGAVALSTQYWRRTGAGGAKSFERSSTASLVLQREGGRWMILIASPWG